MKKQLIGGLILANILLGVSRITAQTNILPSYKDRFTQIRNELYDPANGYFSKDGSPHHSIETIMVEAPDHGHQSTSELYSYWIWLEAMHGKLTNDWKPLNDAWGKMEEHIIPSLADQPTTSAYNPNAPATYASEYPLPTLYPATLETSTPVGKDPVSGDLKSAYGDQIYGMHWLIDNDNFYGYGRRGDASKTPSMINTFQRGEQESTWETVPHPSWEEFKWGGQYGFLPLFTKENNAPSKQWRYTNAPDADARVVQAMYWAKQWAKENGIANPAGALPIDKAIKMGDHLRLAMFDKYFKPIGAQNPNAPGASDYSSAHYLMSWYYAWGGSMPAASSSSNWSWRIGCSHSHFGYQNPVAAYVLSTDPDFAPKSSNGKRDFATSLNRQMELYSYLQSPQGPIAGGVTNSWNGNYSAYPAGKSTFYGMAYVDNPVYVDPGSNTWPGFQGWSMERIAEFYYISKDARAKKLLDKYIPWLVGSIQLSGTTGFKVPAQFAWTGEPDTWNASSPGSNSNLKVNVTELGTDLGVAASFARTLTYYAAATKKHDGVMNEPARKMAQEVLDRMWLSFRDDKGLAAPESRGDYKRFFDQEVHVPANFTGKMANGDDIKPGVKFIDIRTGYKSDPNYPALVTAYNENKPFTISYHRSWAQMEIALANAEYGLLIGNAVVDSIAIKKNPTTAITTPVNNAKFNLGVNISIKATAKDPDGTIANVKFYANGILIGTKTVAPYNLTWKPTVNGVYTIKTIATDNEGRTGESALVKITVGNTPPVAVATASPNSGSKPLVVTLSAAGSTDADNNPLTYVWNFGDGTPTATGVTVTHVYNTASTTPFVATVSVSDGTATSVASTSITVNDKISCNYGTPLATPLPSTQHKSYNYMHVVGNGPSFSNVTNFTINWDLQNNGLWQFAINTNNGQPNWYNDLRGGMSQTFNSAQPKLTIPNSGFPGFTGEYYVTMDGGNFVMVAKNGSHIIYCSNSATKPDCGLSSPGRFGVAEVESTEQNVNVYPNPFKTKFNVSFENRSDVQKVELYNKMGQKLYNIDGKNIKSNTLTVDMKNNKNTDYLLKVTTKKGVITKSVLK
ncbi:MAG: T9SS type A sorting domain-containing protein [Pseudarcicella sp.]|nr:T9SS type A sorting domain-containing protein [Pseudarcicella sp.]MBP6410147.1 T9SS type A sorting domain-containing protein [Pseudarcicella sp.]